MKLLILSGMHGDEFEVIDCVKKYIAEHVLSDYLYIPEVSPSAVAAQTRRNKFGSDVNRSFFDPPTDPEVKEFTEKISGKKFDQCINFHEDPDLAQTFYLYDSGQLTPEQLLTLRSSIIEAGCGLHTGTDDPLDANLDLHVEKGYISTPYETLPQDAGFSWIWLHNHIITKRDVDIEIPGKATVELKQKLVDAVFSFFLTPGFGFK
jgi:predicted deacylase